MQIRSTLIGALVSAALVSTLTIAGTRTPGPGLDPDALAYMGAGQSLAGTGLYRIPSSGWTAADTTAPLAHFPPGFSTAIAIPVLGGASPAQAGRIVVIVASALAAATLFTLVAGVAGFTWAALAVLVVFATPAILGDYLSVLSEPLYIVFVLVATGAFAALRDRFSIAAHTTISISQRAASTASTVITFALAAAAAVMTRYAGAAIVGMGVLYVLTRRAGWFCKVMTSLLIGLPTTIAMGIWVTHGAHGTRNIRKFSIYGGFGDTLQDGFRTLRDVIIPGTGGFVWRSIAAAMGALALCILVGYAWRRAAPRPRYLLGSIGWIMTGCTAMLIVSRILADPGIPADERMLSPIILLGELAVIISVATLWPQWTRAPRLIASALIIAWLIPAAAWSQNRISGMLTYGSDLAADEWRNSPMMAWVRGNANSYTLYTNWPAAVYFQTGRATHSLPEVGDALTLRRFRDRLLRQHGLLIGFTTPSADFVSPDSIAARLQLQAVARFADGVVWAPMTDANHPTGGAGSP